MKKSKITFDKFFERKEKGCYNIAEKPRQISNLELKYETQNEIPTVIDENRSVKWNRIERERLIKELTIKKIKEQSDKKCKWHENEKSQITKYLIELKNMLEYELEMNEKQLWLFLKKTGLYGCLIWDGWAPEFSKKDFEEIKKEKESLFSFFEEFNNLED